MVIWMSITLFAIAMFVLFLYNVAFPESRESVEDPLSHSLGSPAARSRHARR